MKVTYKDHEYEFDLDDMTVAQAKVIKVHTGFTLMKLVAGLKEADPDALRAAFWLMHVQTGITGCNIDTVDFKIVDFINAITKGVVAEVDETGDNPKEP